MQMIYYYYIKAKGKDFDNYIVAKNIAKLTYRRSISGE